MRQAGHPNRCHRRGSADERSDPIRRALLYILSRDACNSEVALNAADWVRFSRVVAMTSVHAARRWGNSAVARMTRDRSIRIPVDFLSLAESEMTLPGPAICWATTRPTGYWRATVTTAKPSLLKSRGFASLSTRANSPYATRSSIRPSTPLSPSNARGCTLSFTSREMTSPASSADDQIGKTG